MSKDDGGQVYPIPDTLKCNLRGISRRDWLAGLAMQGMLSNSALLPALTDDIFKGKEALTISAYTWADAMIADGTK